MLIKVDSKRQFPLVKESKVRGHRGKGIKSDMRGNYLMHHVAGIWNALSEDVVGTTSIGAFGRKLINTQGEEKSVRLQGRYRTIEYLWRRSALVRNNGLWPPSED